MKLYYLERSETDVHVALGIFSTREKAIEHIKKLEPDAVKDTFGDYVIEKKYDKWTEFIDYVIEEFELDVPGE